MYVSGFHSPKHYPDLLQADDIMPGPADGLGSTVAPAQGYSVDDDDDDALEYAENPFEEPAHKK